MNNCCKLNKLRSLHINVLTWSGGGDPSDICRGDGDLGGCGLDVAPCPSSPDAELTFLLLRGFDVTLKSSAC